MPEATPKKKSPKPQHSGSDMAGKGRAQDSPKAKKPQKEIKNPAPSDDKSPVYGSGYAKWNQGYNDCVQSMCHFPDFFKDLIQAIIPECLVNQGTFPSAPNKPAPTQSGNGTGATHTVIVAPTQGVLRYVPFALNASVGDTVKFMWGANNHTVTKSSALLPCNKSLDDAFASGTQNKDFVCM
jgi:plastocyanin